MGIEWLVSFDIGVVWAFKRGEKKVFVDWLSSSHLTNIVLGPAILRFLRGFLRGTFY